jgi:hypothetical protein
MKRWVVYLLGCVTVLVLAGLAYIWLALSWSYSEGERAGFLQKFSKRGWVCKTWEGEILLSSMPGAIPERFVFSVRDDEVAKQMNAAIGKRVVLTYAQHKGLPSTCFGDTEYFIEKVVTAPAQGEAR